MVEERKSGEIEVQKILDANACTCNTGQRERERQVGRERVFMPSGNGRL